MALKTNQMQTDLQKYRDGWDFIFNKNNMNAMFVHQELKKISEIGKAASISAEKLVIQLAKSGEKIGCSTSWDINKVNEMIERLSVISKAASFSEKNKKAIMHLNDLAKVKESDNADRS